jgi:hypothetical protein
VVETHLIAGGVVEISLTTPTLRSCNMITTRKDSNDIGTNRLDTRLYEIWRS